MATNLYLVKLKSNQFSVRDQTRVITYRVPHNAAVQIYDYKEKTSRVVFGPSMVMLGPDEMFTPLNLSGGKPKRPNTIKTLHLMLGPDFMTGNFFSPHDWRTFLFATFNYAFSTNSRTECFSRFDSSEKIQTKKQV